LFIAWLLLPAQDKPAPKVPLGKETTYVTGPLDEEGHVDYAAARNDRLGKGITPERNANALLWKALGPTPEGGKRMPAEFFQRLGMEGPPKGGAYVIELDTYVGDHLKFDRDEFEAVQDQQDRAGQRPWAVRDYSHIAGC
jgi:hypothetical protein